MDRRTFVIAIASAIASLKVGTTMAKPVEIRTDRVRSTSPSMIFKGYRYLELPWDELKFIGLDIDMDNPNILDCCFFTWDEGLQTNIRAYMQQNADERGIRILVTGGQFGKGAVAKCLEIRTTKWNPYLSADEVRPTIFHMRLDYEGEV